MFERAKQTSLSACLSVLKGGVCAIANRRSMTLSKSALSRTSSVSDVNMLATALRAGNYTFESADPSYRTRHETVMLLQTSAMNVSSLVFKAYDKSQQPSAIMLSSIAYSAFRPIWHNLILSFGFNLYTFASSFWLVRMICPASQTSVPSILLLHT